MVEFSLANVLLAAVVVAIIGYITRDRSKALERLLLARIDGFQAVVDGKFLQVGGRIDELGRRIDEQGQRIDELGRRIGQLESRMGRAEGEIAALRSDITQVALAVGARPRPETG